MSDTSHGLALYERIQFRKSNNIYINDQGWALFYEQHDAKYYCLYRNRTASIKCFKYTHQNTVNTEVTVEFSFISTDLLA